jgi:hypothetical protein
LSYPVRKTHSFGERCLFRCHSQRNTQTHPASPSITQGLMANESRVHVHETRDRPGSAVVQYRQGVFGVNSTRTKPGPKAAVDKPLLVWEAEWFWVFHLLVFGISAHTGTHEYWEPRRPPMPVGKHGEPVPESLYRARVRDHREKMRTGAGWVLKKEPYDIKGRPGEPDIWKRLKSARTVAQVRNACRASRLWLNPRETQRPWVMDLQAHAAEFLDGKARRYPKSDRPSSERKRIVHFARVMAGITVGISPARAIDLFRNMQHRANCDCVSCSGC